MEVKRAVRCYRGPDDPGPFSDIINSMSFGCRHMKEYNKNGVFCLTANTPEGYVKVMRVGDVDYIWTEGGTSVLIYIILIPDLLRGFRIPVTLKKGDYTFGEIETLDGTESMMRYQYDINMTMLDGIGVSFEYMPYIFKMLGYSHVSVGYPGSLFYPDPVNDWHNKFYVLDCTGDQSSLFETLWRPPSQVATVAFGEDLLPLWYAMSPLTAHNHHWCFEASIDQSKRIYQPVNTDVLLAGEEVPTPANFTLVQRSLNRYNYLYPLQANRFYGKNAFDVDENNVITAFGESIYVSGVGEYNVPVDIDPILFFWPWIPYLDEIRSFNILSYGGRSLPFGGGFEGFFVTPMLETFKKYGIGYYTNLGAYQTQELFEDDASFSNVTKESDVTNSAHPTECSCGDCGTGSWEDILTSNVSPYNSSGTKYIPIGLIGGKIPISMKTTWQQSGNGPVVETKYNAVVSGNYPWDSLHDGGSAIGLASLYESCCITDFKNSRVRTTAHNETASNHISMQQVLKVGDDIIFEADSSMNYDMEYIYNDKYDGTIKGVVVPPDFVPPECAGSIGYTTQQMSVNQTQNLIWSDITMYPEDPPCQDPIEHYTFTWSLSGGGSLSSTTSQNTVYTAPATNANCAVPVISLICNGNVVDTLELAINGGVGVAIINDVNFRLVDYSDEEYCVWQYFKTRNEYSCDGTLFRTQDFAVAGMSTTMYIINYYGLECLSWAESGMNTYCIEHWGQACADYDPDCDPYLPMCNMKDVRTAAQKAAGCCPAQLL